MNLFLKMLDTTDCDSSQLQCTISGWQCKFSRYFAAQIHFLRASWVVISCLPLFFPQLKQSLKNMRRVHRVRASSPKSTSINERPELNGHFKKYSNPREASDIYFSQLSNDLFGQQ